MGRIISPIRLVSGLLSLPGDKSISHRYAMLAAIAEGSTRIDNYSTGADCASTLACLRAMGVSIEHRGTTVTIEGVGLDGLRAPVTPLDAGNSGSTIRMLAGLLSGQTFESVIAGDASLAQRPMRRIITPLERMGARIEACGDGLPPLRIRGGDLQPIDYELPVASAQVKTAVLFAGLYANGKTTVREPLPTRNHSEMALREFGADITADSGTITVAGRPKLKSTTLRVPADLSSAAFFIVAALLLPGSRLTLENVGLNPTRAALLAVLRKMGADIQVRGERIEAGEAVGDIDVRGPADQAPGALRGGVIEGAMTAAVIDEVPILAVLGAAGDEGLVIRDAAELRVKETDRIATVAENLTRMGVTPEVFDNGMKIPGRNRLRAAELDSFGDHRIAMAFTIAALAADGPSMLKNAAAASVSFPEFFTLLDQVTAA